MISFIWLYIIQRVARSIPFIYQILFIIRLCTSNQQLLGKHSADVFGDVWTPKQCCGASVLFYKYSIFHKYQIFRSLNKYRYANIMDTDK